MLFKNDRPRSILVADPSTDFLETLMKDSQKAQFPLRSAFTGAEAQLAIANVENLFAGIFISSKLLKPNWISVVRCAYQHRPATPVYLISDEGEIKEITEIDLRRLGIKKQIPKPIAYEDLIQLIAPIALSFDAQTALKAAQANADQVGAESTAEDTSFIPIRADDFLSGSVSFFDVYVRLNSGRFLKLLQAGDGFTPDRLESYIKKGVLYFYIKKDVQETYLAYCDHLASALIKHSKAPAVLKATQTMNQGEETMKFLQRNGISENSIRHAAKFVGNVKELTHQLSKDDKAGLLTNFLDNVTQYDHGASTATLAALLANGLDLSNDKSIEIVGMAALLHDIGLMSMPPVLWEGDETKMTTEEVLLYRTHPMVGSAALSKIKGMHPAALQAIEQHHMKFQSKGMLSKGFPLRTATTPVSRVGEIVGICSDTHTVMQRCERFPGMNLLAELEKEVFPYFSRQVVSAFMDVFFPQTKPTN